MGGYSQNRQKKKRIQIIRRTKKKKKEKGRDPAVLLRIEKQGKLTKI